MMKTAALMRIILLLTFFVVSSHGFTTTSNIHVPSSQSDRTKGNQSRKQSRLRYSTKGEDSFLDRGDAATPLPLTAKDLERLTEMKTRGTTMPVVIMESLLPGQKLFFQSQDPKFEEMVKHVLTSSHGDEIGILGLNPHTGNPLNIGVTATIQKNDLTVAIDENSERVLATSFKGKRRFEVVGEPWMDETESFYLANVEIVENRKEMMSPQEKEQAKSIHKNIPNLVQEWVRLLLESDVTTPEQVNSRLQEMGKIPKKMKDRAFWVAGLVNPVPPLGVCVEIRPAMLACRNDHDRMVLASTALQSSIDHLSGKRKLL